MSLFDLPQNRLDVGRGKLVSRRFGYGVQLRLHSVGAIMPGLTQGLTDPFRDTQLLVTSDGLDFQELFLIQEDL